MDQTAKQRFGKEITVVLEEDYGYREWIWFPKMALPELVQWWRIQENITDYSGRDLPYKLPGDMFLVETEEDDALWISGFRRRDCCKAWINSDKHSYLVTSERELVIDRGFPVENLPRVHRLLSKFLD